MELFLLRAVYSSHPLLTRAVLCFALVMALQWLLTRRWGVSDAAVRRQRRRNLVLVSAALAAGMVLTAAGFQDRAVRQGQLDLAATAPLRVAYGDPAAPTIRVFTARGCGPCMHLETQLRQFMHQGYAVQYIPGSLDDQDWDLVTAAVCGPGSGAAFEATFSLAPDARAPVTGAVCRGSVSANEAVQRRLSGHLLYPTVVMPDGLLIVGEPPLDYLRRYLQALAPVPGRPS